MRDGSCIVLYCVDFMHLLHIRSNDAIAVLLAFADQYCEWFLSMLDYYA
jgi:hypothetical protein